MNILNPFSARIKKMKAIFAHRKAFLRVERELLKHNTLSGYLHDVDKLFLLLVFPPHVVSKIHRSYSRHHNKAKTRKHYTQMVIDWECARFTKPDKPLNAYDTLYAYYPNLISEIYPILRQFNLLFTTKGC